MKDILPIELPHPGKYNKFIISPHKFWAQPVELLLLTPEICSSSPTVVNGMIIIVQSRHDSRKNGLYLKASHHLSTPIRFKPFIPDYVPAVGDIDAFIKVKRPDGKQVKPILGELQPEVNRKQ